MRISANAYREQAKERSKYYFATRQAMFGGTTHATSTDATRLSTRNSQAGVVCNVEKGIFAVMSPVVLQRTSASVFCVA